MTQFSTWKSNEMKTKVITEGFTLQLWTYESRTESFPEAESVPKPLGLDCKHIFIGFIRKSVRLERASSQPSLTVR